MATHSDPEAAVPGKGTDRALVMPIAGGEGLAAIVFSVSGKKATEFVSDLERFRGGTSLHNCLGHRITRINAKIEDRELQLIGDIYTKTLIPFLPA